MARPGLLAVGLLERERGNRRVACPFEGVGMVVLLGATFLQAVG